MLAGRRLQIEKKNRAFSLLSRRGGNTFMYVFGYPNKNVHLGIGIYKRVKSICCLGEGKQEDYRPWGR